MQFRHDPKRNKGFSLVELIIVIAILGVCTALLSVSISLIPAYEAKKCATGLDAALSRCKLECMARGGGDANAMTLRCDGDGYFVAQGAAETQIAGSRCAGFYTDGSGVSQALASGDSLKFSFETGTGAFRDGRDVSVLEIKGGSRNYILRLYPDTGAHTVTLG